MSCYGGPIDTPNIDAIAADGVRYTQWHTTALCSPTRSCLLTGRNHTRNSMACITEAAIGFPNASGTIPPENGMLPEILGELGLEHLHGRQVAPVPRRRDEPRRRRGATGRPAAGSSAGTASSAPRRASGIRTSSTTTTRSTSRATPEEGYHLTVDLTDKAIEFIRDAKAIAPEKPFFLYYAPGACHAPHHAPKEWIDKYKGRFDMGYEAMREQTLARQKEMGIVPPDTELPPINPIGTPETRTGPGRQAVPGARRDAAVGLAVRRRAGVCSPAWPRSTPGSSATPTTEIGRLLGFLEEFGWRENTMVVARVRQRRVAARAGPNGSVNEMKFANGIPDTIEANLPMLDELGGPTTYNHYPNGWAMAFNTPFKMWKRYEFNGGTSDPCIISWPAGMTGPRRDPRAVPPRHRPRARRSSTCSASSRPRRSRATPRAASTA